MYMRYLPFPRMDGIWIRSSPGFWAGNGTKAEESGRRTTDDVMGNDGSEALLRVSGRAGAQ